MARGNAYARAKGRSPQPGRGGGVGIQMRFVGGPELAAALRELGEFTKPVQARNALKRGMIKAAQPMVIAARANAPKDYHDLEISIGASTQLSRRQARQRRKYAGDKNSTMEVFVGPDYRAGAHGIFEEFGTGERFRRDAIGAAHGSTGRITAHPFMRPAFDSTYAIVLAGFGPSTWKEIEKATKRAQKKQARALAKGPR